MNEHEQNKQGMIGILQLALSVFFMMLCVGIAFKFSGRLVDYVILGLDVYCSIYWLICSIIRINFAHKRTRKQR